MINIFVIDDHPLLINGIEAVFENKEDKIKIVGTATSAKEALQKLKRSSAKVILLDLLMPEVSGAELCVSIKRIYNDKKIIAFTGETDTALLYSALKNGVDAILMKHCGKQEMVDTIHSVLKGNQILGKGVPELSLLTGVISTGQKIKLTPGEHQVLSKMAIVGNRKQAAADLGLSKNALDFHCKNILKKFSTHNMISAVKEARLANLIYS
jgi:DNA-binding NarL/FixJ family response regulator